nr:LacI family DNA-binding transcriptional regulator [uncultured Oscillibacter sp.]
MQLGVTIRDIAKLAQVSPATVSRYFSGSTIVGAELSKKIEAAATQLGYVPTRTTKRNLGVIIVLVPHLQLGYFSEVLREIIKQMPKYRCKLMILPTTPGDDSYKSFFKELYIHGVIYLEEDIDADMLRYIRAKNIKIIMLGGAAYESHCDYVHINDMAAAYEGMRYLLDLNHRDILILGDYTHHFSSGAQRLIGCQQALKEYNLTYDEGKIVEFGELTCEGGYRSMKKALQQGKKFTAVFAFSDESAIGAISALAESGLKVPRDISVLGFDGIPISEKVVPKLSTIYQPIDKMVEWTLDTLCKVDEKDRPENMEYTLPYKLLERETCIRREEQL